MKYIKLFESKDSALNLEDLSDLFSTVFDYTTKHDVEDIILYDDGEIIKGDDFNRLLSSREPNGWLITFHYNNPLTKRNETISDSNFENYVTFINHINEALFKLKSYYEVPIVVFDHVSFPHISIAVAKKHYKG